jgi:hypothetical protein
VCTSKEPELVASFETRYVQQRSISIQPSSTSRTFSAKLCTENGFWRKSIPLYGLPNPGWSTTFGPVVRGHSVGDGRRVRIELNHQELIDFPKGLEPCKCDNRILAVACNLRRKGGGPVILVTKDLNLIIKADVLSLPAEDFTNDKVDYSRLYTGVGELHLKTEEMDRFYQVARLALNGERTLCDFSRSVGRPEIVRFDWPMMCTCGEKVIGIPQVNGSHHIGTVNPAFDWPIWLNTGWLQPKSDLGPDWPVNPSKINALMGKTTTYFDRQVRIVDLMFTKHFEKYPRLKPPDSGSGNCCFTWSACAFFRGSL